MGLIFVPVIIVIYIGAILSLLVFRLDQSAHEENLRLLAERHTDGDKRKGGEE
jgi:hypothetical protein